MIKIKKLNEELGAKSKEIRTYIDKAAKENRAIPADDGGLKQLETEYETMKNNFDVEVRQAARESGKPIELTKSERSTVDTFDIGKVLRHLDASMRGAPTTLDGAELEMIQEGAREASESKISTRGLVLPRVLVRRGGYRSNVEGRDMTATGTTSVTLDQGGMTIPTNKAGLLDDFFNASVMRAGGATVLEGLTGNLDVPRIIAGTAPAKKAENANADEPFPTTAMLSLQPKRLPAVIDISQQLLRQSSSVIDALLRGHLTGQMLAVQEAAFFHGGGTNEANGIAATSGIGSVAGGAAGLAPAWTHFTQLEEKVDAQNALLGNLHYASNGQIRKKVKETQKASGTDSMMILDDRSGGLLNGYSPLWTNAISRTLVKGGSGSVCSAIFFGNFADYWVGYWSGIELELVRDRPNAIAGLYSLVANAYYDGGVVRPKSFAAMLDALGA